MCPYGQFCEGTDCHSYVWPVLEQSCLSLGTVDALLTFQQSCFKKNECHCQNSMAFYEWESISTFWIKQQAQYFSLSPVRASWTVWTGKMKGQHHWEDKPRLFSVPTLSYCVHAVMLVMCFRDLNLKLRFSSQKPTRWQVITEEMWDSWVGVVGFVPAPRRWQMWGSSPPYLSLLCYLSRPSPSCYF